jgi:enoyl-CoA hydratase
VGKGRALELIMTANMIDAPKALAYGLVNYVVPQEALLPKCYTLADQIKSNSSLAIAAAIRAVNANYMDGVNGYDVEISEFGKCFDTADFIEGTTAFLEKRKSNFPGK